MSSSGGMRVGLGWQQVSADAKRLAAPLLVLHGTADQAVPVLQSFRLVDALVRAGNDFDVGLYPGETHAFTYRHTWEDAMARVDRFFAETLR